MTDRKLSTENKGKDLRFTVKSDQKPSQHELKVVKTGNCLAVWGVSLKSNRKNYAKTIVSWRDAIYSTTQFWFPCEKRNWKIIT